MRLFECLVRGEELKLSNFGVFSIKQKSERPGRNPKSGESAIIKARQVVSFHPSGQLRKEVVEGRKHAAIALQASGAEIRSELAHSRKLFPCEKDHKFHSGLWSFSHIWRPAAVDPIVFRSNFRYPKLPRQKS